MKKMGTIKKFDFIKIIIFYLLLLLIFMSLDEGIIGTCEIFIALFYSYGFIKVAILVFIYLSSIAVLVLAYLSRFRLFRYIAFLITLISLVIFLGYKSVNSYGYDFGEAVILLKEFQFAGEALLTFFYNYIRAIVISFMIVISIVVLSSKLLPKIKSYFMVIPFSPLVIYLIFAKTGGFSVYLPVVFKVPLITYFAYAKASTKLNPVETDYGLDYGMKSDPYFKPSEVAMAKHIILIIDESIRGDKLSINGFNKKTTPYLESISDSIFNFGIMSSSSNCSWSSNLILRKGIQIDELPDKEQKTLLKPTIFQYAKLANFKTFYIDGQHDLVKDENRNQLTSIDFEHIDTYYYIRELHKNIKYYETDRKIADYLVMITESDSPTFTYVNKVGAHFHYESSYPQNQRVFRPTLKYHRVLDKLFIPGLQETLNSYYNAIKWSVDGFFNYLLPKIKDRDLLILYTSDHGQSLSQGRITQCQFENPPSSQANVPFIIFPMNNKTVKLFKKKNKNFIYNKNKVSHFEIFPTILIMMGFNKDEVIKQYGLTIFDKLEGNREFISGDLFVRWPKWEFYKNKFRLIN